MDTDLTPAQSVVRSWGTNLRDRRRELKMSQTTLANRIHCDQTTISRLERGEGVWTPEVMLVLAVTLNQRVARLFPWWDGIEALEAYRIERAGQRKVA
jgi:ribosome-binding protein aMBF1 (putative translation factor)